MPEKLLSFAVRCKNLTVSNMCTVLLTPEIYVSQIIYEQLLDLLLEGFRTRRSCRLSTRLILFSCFPLLFLTKSQSISEPEEMVEFLEEVIAGLLSEHEVRTFEEVMGPVFDIFLGRIKDMDLCQPALYSYLDILLYFSHNKDIAKVRTHTILTSYQLI